MRKFVKKNLLNLIDTVSDIHITISDCVHNHANTEALNLLADCQEFAESIYATISSLESNDCPVLEYISDYYQVVFNVYNNIQSDNSFSTEILVSSLDSIKKSLINDVDVKFEIVFLPYKAAMWDSFDSIYDAAIADPRCDVKVIPIPYYDRNPDKSFGEFHYEGDLYPEHIAITNYEEYDLDENRPDVIYIHNPYDNANTVTSVDPRFYSKELKKYTDMLVYVPYHISGSFSGYDSVINNIPMAFLYVDKIVVQSESMKKYYMYGGIPESKFIESGSPKIDYVINKLPLANIPSVWTETINNRKVILINSTIGRVLSDINWLNNMEELLDTINNNKNICFIWRPHPLLKETIFSQRPEFIEGYNKLIKEMNECENVIIDFSPSAYPAMKISDGMITDYSSLAFQYLFTKKPVFIVGELYPKPENTILVINYYSSYFDTNMSYNEFLSLIKHDYDIQKEKRLQDTLVSVYSHDINYGAIIHESTVVIF